MASRIMKSGRQNWKEKSRMANVKNRSMAVERRKWTVIGRYWKEKSRKQTAGRGVVKSRRQKVGKWELRKRIIKSERQKVKTKN